MIECIEFNKQSNCITNDTISFVSFITYGNAWQYTIVVLTRFRPFIKYDTFYKGDIYQENARQNTILTVRLFIKFNTFYHNDN
jgi:hypothetical protein